MSDVTPKTESGRALIARLYPSVAPDGSGRQPGFVWAEYDHLQIDILAIEREAASAAVAEVRELAEAVIAFVPLATIEPPTQWQRNRDEKARRAIAALFAALIASERGKELT